MVEIYKYLKLSRLSVLGYTYKYENLKNDIISNLNHIIINDPNKHTIESLIRNDKINQVLNYDKENYEYLVVDFMNLKDAFVQKGQSPSSYFDNVKFKKSQIDRLVKLAGSKYKVLVTCQMYNTPTQQSIQKIAVGNDLLYSSELVFTVGEKIEIIKNRYF